ncbi:MAG: arsenate reductase ArsC [Nitrospirae bacterium]|nr:MAG: arsenate reductase ArsC [Nitrospirota bacterium]
MGDIKVLFVCVHNSARSQMAEAFLDALGHGVFKAESAGLEPGELNSVVVDVMREAGIDIAGNKTKSVFDLYKQGQLFNYVITVCDAAGSERCPIFPGAVKRLHWSFEDPSLIEGSYEEKLERVRKIRDSIKLKIESWLKSIAGR